MILTGIFIQPTPSNPCMMKSWLSKTDKTGRPARGNWFPFPWSSRRWDRWDRFLSGIFHSRANIDIFSNWSSVYNKNADFKIIPEPFAQSDEHQSIPLDDNGPPYTQARPDDWLNQSEHDISIVSAKNYSFEFNEFDNDQIPSPVIPSPIIPSCTSSNLPLPSPVKTEDEEAFYGFKNQPNISVVDAMELFHSIIEINSKDEHQRPVSNSKETPRVGLNKTNSRIEKRPIKEPLDKKMNRYIPMKFFAEFISSFMGSNR